MITLAVIAGPTASGKTGLAIELARELGGEIVNADSQQLYRGLDVGTAKPTARERATVPHHLLDVAEPGEGMDAKRWCDLADAAIAGMAARGRFPLVVGGTGLYLRALLHGVVDAPGRDPQFRAQLEEQAQHQGRAVLHRRLAEVDPEAARRIRPNDLVRVVRALEMAAGGTLQSELFARHRFAPDRYHARILAIDLPRAELHRRIGARVEAMFTNGMLDEARALQRRFPGGLPQKLPLGYAEAAACARGDLPLAEAVRRVQVAHRRYARRQIIWLRKERSVTWCSPPWNVPELARLCRSAT
jgi:tRNA dimethylallyltransferase